MICSEFVNLFQESKPVIVENVDVKTEGFQFGTSIEKSITPSEMVSNAFMAKINEEGLCHPNLFADPKRREEKYIKNLFELRQKLIEKGQ